MNRLSKRHFTINANEAGQPVIRDLSTNGTYINGKRVKKTTEIVLSNGDSISIWLEDGNKVLMFKVATQNVNCPYLASLELCQADGLAPTPLKKDPHSGAGLFGHNGGSQVSNEVFPPDLGPFSETETLLFLIPWSTAAREEVRQLAKTPKSINLFGKIGLLYPWRKLTGASQRQKPLVREIVNYVWVDADHLCEGARDGNLTD
ncbi:hypothetical protein B0J13DRAFT_573477, partial [Dactylonectria estremocensis]